MKKFVFFLLIVATACTTAAIKEKTPINTNQIALEELYDPSLKPFYHGVASGDPLPDRVIIWTKVTPGFETASIPVDWEIAKDAQFDQIVGYGQFQAEQEHGFTVKIDVEKLHPGTKYFYRFKCNGIYSLVGKTKTAPQNVEDSLKFAVVSCSNYEFGFFNAYRSLADRIDLDAILHLGDYIYEHGTGVYGDTLLGRRHLPSTEIISLEDYRMRFSQYRLDKDLQAVHQNHPFIAIWDDHEIANDAYKEGAQNHQDNEGAYQDRKQAAKKAYYEWLPIRESENLYRSFHYGKLVDIIMLDERLAGREAPVESIDDPLIDDIQRTMLGKEQLLWLNEQLTTSNAQWKIIGNQVIFSYLNWGFPTWDINMDSWDGYPTERKAIKETIVNNGIENVIFVTGDTHSSWAFEVTDNPFENYNQETSEGAFALEFGTTSITSSNSDESMSTDSVKLHEEKIVNTNVNPHLKYANLRDHGYLIITPSKKVIKAEWVYIKTLEKPSNESFLAKRITVPSGSVNIE